MGKIESSTELDTELDVAEDDQLTQDGTHAGVDTGPGGFYVHIEFDAPASRTKAPWTAELLEEMDPVALKMAQAEASHAGLILTVGPKRWIGLNGKAHYVWRARS